MAIIAWAAFELGLNLILYSQDNKMKISHKTNAVFVWKRIKKCWKQLRSKIYC